MICQLATCDDRRPRTSLGLPPYTLITHSVKKRQPVKPVCAIEQSKYKSNRKSSREAGEREREVGSLTTPRTFSLKIGLETSQIVLSPVWCLKLRQTIRVQLAPFHGESRRP
ncbi:hypothetical protein TNCV_483941 [Trichonephila clavipes]|nr:hypothetical protein TNCV_483941 [Trichonephila clavipes]